MRPGETKSERFRRLAEARTNKLIAMMRLLGNLCKTGFYEYDRDQVEQIFTTLQLELIKNKMRFLQPERQKRKRFSLSEPYEIKDSGHQDQPALAIPLPDGTYGTTGKRSGAAPFSQIDRKGYVSWVIPEPLSGLKERTGKVEEYWISMRYEAIAPKGKDRYPLL